MQLSYGRVQPSELTVTTGQTVHFRNANAAAGPVTVVGEDGAFESPTLGRAEDWHRRFDTPGSFPFHVVEFPASRGTITVVAPAQ